MSSLPPATPFHISVASLTCTQTVTLTLDLDIVIFSVEHMVRIYATVKHSLKKNNNSRASGVSVYNKQTHTVSTKRTSKFQISVSSWNESFSTPWQNTVMLDALPRSRTCAACHLWLLSQRAYYNLTTILNDR